MSGPLALWGVRHRHEKGHLLDDVVWYVSEKAAQEKVRKNPCRGRGCVIVAPAEPTPDPTTSQRDLARDVAVRLEQENARLEADNAALEVEVGRLRRRVAELEETVQVLSSPRLAPSKPLTGPEHFAEGQLLLVAADDGSTDSDSAAFLVAAAQAHFTAALVRATLDSATEPLVRKAAYNTWDEVPS